MFHNISTKVISQFDHRDVNIIQETKRYTLSIFVRLISICHENQTLRLKHPWHKASVFLLKH